MADVQVFVYKSRRVSVTVNKNGTRYLGVIEIEGMKLGAEKVGVEEDFAGAAFASAKRRAEELIDGEPLA